MTNPTSPEGGDVKPAAARRSWSAYCRRDPFPVGGSHTSIN